MRGDQLVGGVGVEPVVERHVLALQHAGAAEQARAWRLRGRGHLAGAGSRRSAGRRPSRRPDPTNAGQRLVVPVPPAGRTSPRRRRRRRRCGRTRPPPAAAWSPASRRPPRRSRRGRRRTAAGSTTTVTDSKFFAAARIMAGPPMSMFSIDRVGVGARCHGLAERIQPADQQVERLDARTPPADGRDRVATIGEQPAVDRGVQRLDAAPEHLGRAGDVFDRGDGEARLGQHARGPARGDELDAALGQRRRERDQARSCRRAPGSRAGSGSHVAHAVPSPRIVTCSTLHDQPALQRAPAPPPGSRRCSAARMRGSSESQSSSSRTSIGFLQHDRTVCRPLRRPGRR